MLVDEGVSLCVFFFKQKTAYEMRISDWSSDVCSSDLPAHPRQAGPEVQAVDQGDRRQERPQRQGGWRRPHAGAGGRRHCGGAEDGRGAGRHRAAPLYRRSEEHTSELQSLMRNSYAVFCLTKKKKKTSMKHQCT